MKPTRKSEVARLKARVKALEAQISARDGERIPVGGNYRFPFPPPPTWGQVLPNTTTDNPYTRPRGIINGRKIG